MIFVGIPEARCDQCNSKARLGPSPLLHLANAMVARSTSTSPFARRLSKLLGATLQSADRRVESLFRWLPDQSLRGFLR